MWVGVVVSILYIFIYAWHKLSRTKWGHLAVMDEDMEDDKSFLYSKSEESEERRVEANYSTIPLTNKYTQHTLIGDVSLKGQWRE